MASAIGAFPYKKKLTIKTDTGGAGLGGSLTDFPVCVVVNSDSWSTQAERNLFFSGNNNTAGKRVQFFASDGTTNLAYEVQSFTASTSAVYWVKVGSLSKSDTANYVYVAYGSDPNGADQDQGTSVWDSNFKGVWHLGYALTDSTSNAVNLTATGTSTSGGFRTFNGTSDYLKSADSPSALNITGSLSVEAHFKLTSWSANWAAIASKAYSNTTWNEPYQQYVLGRFSSGSKLRFARANSTTTYNDQVGTTTDISTSAYQHLAGTYESTNKKMNVYVNGVADAAEGTFTGTTPSASTRLVVGCSHYWASYSEGWSGYLGELRISATNRSADWLKATYYSLNSTTWAGDGWVEWSAAEAQWFPSRASYGARQAVTRAATR